MSNFLLSFTILTLFLKDKTYGLFLVTTLHTRATDTKALAKLLGLGSKVLLLLPLLLLLLYLLLLLLVVVVV
jgi:hypothetical protein